MNRNGISTPVFLGFPDGKAGIAGKAAKESACDMGDLSLIPGLRRSLEKETATHSSILAWRIPRRVQDSTGGCKEPDTTEPLSLS